MKLGKDRTHGDVHSDTFRVRGTGQDQIPAIHQFMRIARMGYGVYGCLLI